jgi:hypothetical protein
MLGNQQSSHRFRKLCIYHFCQYLRPDEIKQELVKPSDSPLIGFRGKRIDALGKISLPVSFGGQENARTEYMTFDVVDLY